MKPVLGFLGVASLCLLSSLPKSNAQAISPGKGIDDVEVITVTAVVNKVDLEKRKVTLTLDNGKTKTYKIDKAAVNLDQVQVGDHVKMSYTEELIVTVNKSGETPSTASVGAVNLAPRGSKPGGVMVDTTAISGKILAIDTERRKVTHEDAQGKKNTVKVNKALISPAWLSASPSMPS